MGGPDLDWKVAAEAIKRHCCDMFHAVDIKQEEISRRRRRVLRDVTHLGLKEEENSTRQLGLESVYWEERHLFSLGLLSLVALLFIAQLATKTTISFISPGSLRLSLSFFIYKK